VKIAPGFPPAQRTENGGGNEKISALKKKGGMTLIKKKKRIKTCWKTIRWGGLWGGERGGGGAGLEIIR